MDQLYRVAESYFSQPIGQLFLMILLLVLVGYGSYVAYPAVAPVLLSNL